MKMQNIENIGVVNLNNVEAVSANIKTFIHIKVFDKELDSLLNKLEADFEEKHSEAGEKINFSIYVLYSFGGWSNAEYELEVYIWDDEDESIAECYNEIKVNLSDQAGKEIKKIIWCALGETLLGL